MIGAGLVAWAAGDLYYDFVLTRERAIPYPSFSDALYFADYAALVFGVSLLTTRPAGTRAFSLSILVTFLGLATVWSWVVFGAVIETAAGGTTAVATTLAYPLFDLFLLTSLLLALAARNWRLDRVLVCLAAGFAVTVTVDSIYAVQVAEGTYENNSVLTSLWPLGTLLIAAAAWIVPERATTAVQKSAGAIAPTFTTIAIAVAITALLWDHFWELGSLTILLAGLTLVAGCAQLTILYRGQKAAMAQALRSERLRGASTRAALDCVITVDAEGIVREWNEAATRTFGYASHEAVGRELAELIIPPASRAKHREGLARLADSGEARILNKRIETVGMHAGGGEFPIELAITRISDDPPMYTGFVRDIGDRKAHEAENEWLASIVRSSEDSIISRDLEGNVAAWNHGAERLYGYSAEEAIGQSADSLILPFDADDGTQMIMATLAAGKVAAFETQRRCKDGELVTVALRAFLIRDYAGETIGTSAIAHDITDRKRREQQEEDDSETGLWRGRIEAALDDDRLLFFSQPIVCLRTGSVDHRELLIRMDLDGETISPGAFLPHAEKSELITRIDRWAIQRGIELARSGRVAINLSARSLDNLELSEWIAAALRDRALAQNVIFEITETAAAANLDAAESLVKRLTDLGCGVALDDFGTGYGSFTYLKRLPVTELKIDMEFIRGLTGDAGNQRVVRSIVSRRGISTSPRWRRESRTRTRSSCCAPSGSTWCRGTTSGIRAQSRQATTKPRFRPRACRSLPGGRIAARPSTTRSSRSCTGCSERSRTETRTRSSSRSTPRSNGCPRRGAAPPPGVTTACASGCASSARTSVSSRLSSNRSGNTASASWRSARLVDGRGAQPFATRVGWIFSFRDGLIVHGRAYPSWSAARAAAGGVTDTAENRARARGPARLQGPSPAYRAGRTARSR